MFPEIQSLGCFIRDGQTGSNFNYANNYLAPHPAGMQKGPCRGKWGNLEGMLVNREICLSFHFDEIENIRPTARKNSKMARLKYIAHASLEEVFSSLWISIDLEKIHCALSSFFLFFLYFFRYYIDQCSQGCCFAKETRASHRPSRRINGIGQFGELCFGRWVFVLGENSGKRKLNCPRRESRWSFRKRDYK